MAELVVQSRFAGLKIEDDDHPPDNEGQKSKKCKPTAAAAAAAKKIEPPKKAKITTNKTQNVPKKKKPKQHSVSANQWEMWKQKDAELVDGNYETELQQAIILSKLDYEEKKDIYKNTKKESDIEKKISEQNAQSGNKKQRKRIVMSLEQFNEMVDGGDETAKVNHEEQANSMEEEVSKQQPPIKDSEFFERMDDDARNELFKDMVNDRVRYRQSLPDEIISKVQFMDTIEKKDKEIEKLKKEITGLKDELYTVKCRNKKLCNILGHGEMKDKAEVLVEVERLRAVQAELTAEIAALHTHLEKERSRNAQDSRSKEKRKKRINSDKEN